MEKHAAVSVAQLSRQSSAFPSVIFISRPMNQYLLGDLEMGTEGLLLEAI